MAQHAVSREALADALQRSALSPVELRETHVSWVLLADDCAYKLKKPVRYPFVDQSTPERRRALCEEEVRVNAALAGEVVLGVRAVVQAGSSLALADADAPGALDWVVAMRRFDEEQTMAALLERGKLTAAHIDAVGARIAAFHREAVRVDADLPAVVGTAVRANLDELGAAAGDRLDAARLTAAQRLTEAFLLARREDLEDRARTGRVVDGHGDLRAEHVLLGRAAVTVVDRLEFDPRLRHVDVADDLAFLVMDLEGRGGREEAERLVGSYRAAGGDPGDRALLAFYAAYRAQVRAKVALLGGRDAEALRLLSLGESFAWRARGPLVLLVTGPPASGKSTLARAIARASGLPVVSSDEVRHEIAGDGERYSDARRGDVYAESARRAGRALEQRGGVIVDATFGERPLQTRFLDALSPGASDAVRVLECAAPLPVLLDRAARRAAAGGDASEADPRVTAVLAERHAPMSVPGSDRLVVETSSAPDVQLERVASWLDARLSPLTRRPGG